MKKLILLFFLVGTLFNCSNDDNASYSNELVGSWRLKKTVTFSGEIYDLDEFEAVI